MLEWASSLRPRVAVGNKSVVLKMKITMIRERLTTND